MRSDRYKNIVPWYKQFWGWVIIAAFVIGIVGIGITALFDGATSSKSAGSGSAENTIPSTQLTVGYENYKVESSKVYNINYSNNDWDEANVGIKRVTIYKLKHPYKVEVSGDKKETVTGFIKLNMSVKALDDITTYPTQAIANYKDEQAEGMGSDTWDGDINKDAQKSGTVYFPVKDLKNVSSISSMRLTFDGHNQNHIEDEHDYDITINLKNGKVIRHKNANKTIEKSDSIGSTTSAYTKSNTVDSSSKKQEGSSNTDNLEWDGTRKRSSFKSDSDFQRYNAWHQGYNYDPATDSYTEMNDDQLNYMREQMNKDGGQSFQ